MNDSLSPATTHHWRVPASSLTGEQALRLLLWVSHRSFEIEDTPEFDMNAGGVDHQISHDQ